MPVRAGWFSSRAIPPSKSCKIALSSLWCFSKHHPVRLRLPPSQEGNSITQASAKPVSPSPFSPSFSVRTNDNPVFPRRKFKIVSHLDSPLWRGARQGGVVRKVFHPRSEIQIGTKIVNPPSNQRQCRNESKHKSIRSCFLFGKKPCQRVNGGIPVCPPLLAGRRHGNEATPGCIS